MLMRNAKMLLNDAFSYATVLFTNHKKKIEAHIALLSWTKSEYLKLARGVCEWYDDAVWTRYVVGFISFVISHTYLISAFIADNGFLNKGTEKVSLDCDWKTLNPRWRLRARWKHQELKPNNITLYWTLRPQTRFDMHQVRSGTTLQNRLHLPS